MEAPKYKQPEADPGLAILMQQNEQQDVAALRDRAAGDTASILARYGAMLAGAPSMQAAGR